MQHYLVTVKLLSYARQVLIMVQKISIRPSVISEFSKSLAKNTSVEELTQTNIEHWKFDKAL